MSDIAKGAGPRAGAPGGCCLSGRMGFAALTAWQAQHLVYRYGVRPELAALVAAAVFGGGHGHG